MRYIVVKVEWYAYGRTYELRNVGIGASYGLGPTKILYCDQLYRFDRFYLDQSVLFLSRSHWSPLFYLHLARAGHVSLLSCHIVDSKAMIMASLNIYLLVA